MGRGPWPTRFPTSSTPSRRARPPLHYVTYVSVYGATPQTVSVGYTPGYYGTVLAPTGVVVYGTGYVYPPVHVVSFWYRPLATYGGSGAGCLRVRGRRCAGG